ncbi:MAG: hypothetical protein N3B14_08645 [Thermoleophilia bacterium]|nr:hypothetical protein [Thermoleophilia bacterium]
MSTTFGLSGKRPTRHVYTLATVTIVAALVVASMSLLLSCGGTKTTPSAASTEATSSQTDQPATGTSENAQPAAGTGESIQTDAGNADFVTAKQAVDLLREEAKRWAPDAVLVTLGAQPRNDTIKDGLCNYWSAAFFSPSVGEVYAFNYYKDKYMKEPDIGRANKPLFQGINWDAPDLLSIWKVDSPEAFKIAVQHGLAEIVHMEVSLREIPYGASPPAEVPQSSAGYWRIEDENEVVLYMDAATGEVLSD